jgi:hypothetical protein
LTDIADYIHTLSDIAEQHQIRLGLANYNLEMNEEITNTVINTQRIISEEQHRYATNEELTLSNALGINKNRTKYMHRGRKGYY